MEKIAAVTLAHADTLTDKLDAQAAASAKKLPPKTSAAFAQGVEAVKEAGIMKNAKKVGDRAPLIEIARIFSMI